MRSNSGAHLACLREEQEQRVNDLECERDGARYQLEQALALLERCADDTTDPQLLGECEALLREADRG